MGVPSFYRWLVRKYPKIVVNAVEEEGVEDSTLPNPNELEFDNFYIDMNGIIHQCFHPEDSMFPPTTYEEVFQSVYGYLDRLFNIVRPRKLLYLAIDGVAPRAKMNQQRARRFRTAKDKEIMDEEERKLREKFKEEGKQVLEKEESQVSDSNVITPGTFFMYRLSEKLQSYIQRRIGASPGWKNIKVVLSDSNVPGEGEHKINSFIRAQRTFPDYDPNTRHCLYGLDADLIMLALASHELHFSVFRENVLIQDDLSNRLSSLELSFQKAEAQAVKSRGWFKKHDDAVIESGKAKISRASKNTFQFLHVWVLRDYLEVDICDGLLEDSKAHPDIHIGTNLLEDSKACLDVDKGVDPPKVSKADLERVIDDFVFMCFFAGNDFLPHMPTLDIHEGAIDLLIYVYKKEFKNLGGYLVDMQRVEDPKAGYIKLSRVEKFILYVGTFEEKIFAKRMEIREKRNRRVVLETRDDMSSFNDSDLPGSGDFDEDRQSDADDQQIDIPSILENTKDLKQKLKDILRHNADTFKHGITADKVKLGSPGWRERYYTQKFELGSNADVEKTRKDVVAHYTEGLMWVLLYYFKGVPSWGWYYPYHYGPFASDMKGMSQTRVKFKMEEPFKPFDQLMSVLPPGSARALPEVYHMLMHDDEKSSIIDFYPTDFETDLDGKRFLWQGITKLPFIEEDRLLKETRALDKFLMDIDQKRNSKTSEQLFMESSCKLAPHILCLFEKGSGLSEHDAIKVDRKLSGGINGFVWLNNDHINHLPRECLCVFFSTSPIAHFIPRILSGTDFPEKIASKDDIDETVLWHELHGRPGNSGYRSQNQGSRSGPNDNPRNHRTSVPIEVVSCTGRGSLRNHNSFVPNGGWAGRGNYRSEPRHMNQWQAPRPPMGVSPYQGGARYNAVPRQQIPWRAPTPPAIGATPTPRNEWQVPRPLMIAPPIQGGVRYHTVSSNIRQENPWRAPRSPLVGPMPNRIDGNPSFRNGHIRQENPWRAPRPPLVGPMPNRIDGNPSFRNGGMENQWRVSVMTPDQGGARWRSASGNNWQQNR